MGIVSRYCQRYRVRGDLRLLIGTPQQKRPFYKVALTPAQKRLVLASGPDDITGEEGHGIEISGSSYRVARQLHTYGLGHYTQGSPYGDLYFNNAAGLKARAAIAMEARRGETGNTGSIAEGDDSAGPKDIAQ